jgi:hypothetical protein
VKLLNKDFPCGPQLLLGLFIHMLGPNNSHLLHAAEVANLKLPSSYEIVVIFKKREESYRCSKYGCSVRYPFYNNYNRMKRRL